MENRIPSLWDEARIGSKMKRKNLRRFVRIGTVNTPPGGVRKVSIHASLKESYEQGESFREAPSNTRIYVSPSRYQKATTHYWLPRPIFPLLDDSERIPVQITRIQKKTDENDVKTGEKKTAYNWKYCPKGDNHRSTCCFGF